MWSAVCWLQSHKVISASVFSSRCTTFKQHHKGKSRPVSLSVFADILISPVTYLTSPRMTGSVSPVALRDTGKSYACFEHDSPRECRGTALRARFRSYQSYIHINTLLFLIRKIRPVMQQNYFTPHSYT